MGDQVADELLVGEIIDDDMIKVDIDGDRCGSGCLANTADLADEHEPDVSTATDLLVYKVMQPLAVATVGGEVAMAHGIEGCDPAALFGLALALTGNRYDAEDLVQAALARMLSADRTIRSPHAYLRRTMVNLHVDGLRREKIVREEPGDVPEVAAAGNLADWTIDKVDIEAALSTLPELERTVVILRYLEDLPSYRIAALLGQPAGTTRRLISNGIAKLRILNLTKAGE